MDSADWKPWRTFFFAIKGDVNFDFQNNEKLNGILTGKIKNINLKANEVKVYSKDKEIPSEETQYIQRINDFLGSLGGVELSNVFEKIPVLGGIPI